MAKLAVVFGFGNAQEGRDWRKYSLSRYTIVAASAGLFAFSVYAYVHFLDEPTPAEMKRGYNDWHPFMGVVWIALFLLVRNCCSAFRERVLFAFEFLGKYSLELYLLQFHLLLSRSARRVLVIIENYPYTNLALLFVLYVFAAMRTHELTLYLRGAFFGLKTALEYIVAICASVVIVGLNYTTNSSTPRVQIWVACGLGVAAAAIAIMIKEVRRKPDAQAVNDVPKVPSSAPGNTAIVEYDAGSAVDVGEDGGIELGAIAPEAGFSSPYNWVANANADADDSRSYRSFIDHTTASSSLRSLFRLA